MEIVGVDFGAGNFERRDSLGFYVNYAILILEWPFDPQKPAARDDHTVTLEDVRSNDDVGDAGLIFEREKNESLCCAWPLARDDATGNAHKSVIAAVRQIVCRENALRAQGSTMVGHWVRARSEPRACIVSRDTLVCSHLP